MEELPLRSEMDPEKTRGRVAALGFSANHVRADLYEFVRLAIGDIGILSYWSIILVLY